MMRAIPTRPSMLGISFSIMKDVPTTSIGDNANIGVTIDASDSLKPLAINIEVKAITADCGTAIIKNLEVKLGTPW